MLGSCAGDAKFGTSATQNLVPALQLMRMVGCSCKRPDWPLRSGMLLRWLHLLRHILAACPATRVCLQPLLKLLCLTLCLVPMFGCPTPMEHLLHTL